jgi:hypothetical protein
MWKADPDQRPQAAEPADFDAGLEPVLAVPDPTDDSGEPDEEEPEPDSLVPREGLAVLETLLESLLESLPESLPDLLLLVPRESLRESLR